MKKLSKILQNRKCGFSLAEALITLLIVCIITLASVPVLTKKKRSKLDNQRHGYYACYWDANGILQAKMMYNSVISDGKVVWDEEEGRYGCEFNPPSGAKNFVATIIGGGGGGAGAAALSGHERKTFTTPGMETWFAPDTGIYEFLVVGGGGGGGSGDDEYNGLRGGAGSPGEFVYINNIEINKNEPIEVTVGEGGGAADDLSGMGKDGNLSRVEIENPDIRMTAQGGGGGVGYDIADSCGVFGSISQRLKQGALRGYNFQGEYKEYNFGCGSDQPKMTIFGSGVPGEKRTYPGGVKTFMSYFWDLKGSDNPNESEIIGKGAAGLSSIIQKTNGATFWSEESQNKFKYNNNENLAKNYNDKFGLKFNVPVQSSSPAGLLSMHNLPCKSLKYENYTGVLTPIGNSIMKRYGYCFDFENNYGAGGGGGGRYDGGSSMTSSRYDVKGVPGKDGFVGIKYKAIYAGLGGEAGKVMQIPYSELPQKTLLFPGRGGQGGFASPNISKSSLLDKKKNKTEGHSGQTSYIKNGTPVLGGAGAPQIDARKDSTYLSEKTMINSNSIKNKFLAGGNGKLSDVLTSKKESVGGLGGYNGTNNSANGSSLNGVIFQNGAAIGSFNRIYGAGAGGGGGSAYAGVVGTNVQTYGNGGDGASGLVFIQW